MNFLCHWGERRDYSINSLATLSLLPKLGGGAGLENQVQAMTKDAQQVSVYMNNFGGWKHFSNKVCDHCLQIHSNNVHHHWKSQGTIYPQGQYSLCNHNQLTSVSNKCVTRKKEQQSASCHRQSHPPKGQLQMDQINEASNEESNAWKAARKSFWLTCRKLIPKALKYFSLWHPPKKNFFYWYLSMSCQVRQCYGQVWY